MSNARDLARRQTALILGAVCLAFCDAAVATTGLGSLEGLWVLFLAIAAAVAAGLVIIPGLIYATRRKRAGDRIGALQKFILGMAIVFLILLFPVVAGSFVAPRLSPWFYAPMLVYLAVLAFTVLYFYDNSKRVFGFAAALLCIVLLRTPEIVSYTRYDFVENSPIEAPIAWLEQLDSEYLALPDGRLFRIDSHFAGSSFGEKFPVDAILAIEETSTSSETRLYNLYQAVKSQQTYQHEMSDVEPLITIPLRTISFSKYESRNIARIQLLNDDWRADNQVLARAVNTFCCNAAWVKELLQRGANADFRYGGSDWTVFHAIARKSPYGPDMAETARLLAMRGADINASDSLGRSGFHAALNAVLRDSFREERLEPSQRQYLVQLLKLGADVNVQDKDLRTPLHDTIYARFYSLSRWLLENGADVTLQDKYGNSSLDVAIEYRDEQTAVLSDAEEVAIAKLIEAMQRRTSTRD